MVARGRSYGSPTPPTVPIVLSVAVGPDLSHLQYPVQSVCQYPVMYVLPIYPSL